MHGVQEVAAAWPVDGQVEDFGARLPARALDELAAHLAPGDRAFRFRFTSKASYARRRSAANGSGEPMLSPAESERVARIGRLWDFAVEVWGEADKARDFLNRRHMLLRGRLPIDVALASEQGAREVEDIIGGVAYGTYT